MISKVFKMQLRSGRKIVKRSAEVQKNKLAEVPPPIPAANLSKKNPRTASPIHDVFRLLDNYNNILIALEAKYTNLEKNFRGSQCTEIKLIEDTLFRLDHECTMEAARIYAEMFNVKNEYFDVISEGVHPFMLIGMVFKNGEIYDTFNNYKHTYLQKATKHNIKDELANVERTIDILLNEIDIFDNKYSDYISNRDILHRLYKL